ncbi:MAG TPA: DNA primase noncatalytic subunit PriX [Nitrososphaeraceae archaeon]|nr:DNA primase noncatalytic subunit PriX [Nitrososphaeraceae archaeon]
MCTVLQMSVTFHPLPPSSLRLIHHLLIFSKSRLYCIWCCNTPYSCQVKECNRCHGIIQSNNKADKFNNPSFKSCLLRIPNSLNSKCLAREDVTLENSKVKIIQQWNGYRPPIKELLYDFRRYLIQKKVDTYNYRQKILLNARRRIRYNKNLQNTINSCCYYDWIENIILNPFEDCRKIIVDLILAPYLINIKKLSYQESYQIIREWLDKCNSLHELDNIRNFEYRIYYALKRAEKKGIGPISKEKIQIEYNFRRLYLLVKQKENTLRN